MFGSSGGAIVGLELASRDPNRATALVAHEPPLSELLPDAERWREPRDDLRDTCRRAGVEPTFEMFQKAMGFDDDPEPDPSQMPVEAQEMVARIEGNLPHFLEHGVRIADYAPDIAALRAASTRVGGGGGDSSRDQLPTQGLERRNPRRDSREAGYLSSLGLGYCREVATESPQGGERVRAAEVMGALCLATDLGMGFPFEHGLHTTLVATRLAERLGVDPATESQTYYASLLAHSGCTTDAHVTAEVFGGSLTAHLNPVMFGSRREVLSGIIRALPQPESAAPARAVEAARRLPRMARRQRPHLAAMCEVAQMLAERVGLPSSVWGLLAHLFERWDGKSPLGRAKGADIPLPMRIVSIAADATLQRLLGDEEHVVRVARDRAGHGFDPEVAACLADNANEILALDPEASTWDEVLAREPHPRLTLEDEAIDRALAAMGNFADLISPYLAGHSAGVAELAAEAAERCRMGAAGASTVRRAALVHDLGRVAIGAKTWQKPGPLSADEWEQVRLHPYHTERVLSRSPFLAALAQVAGAHHERLDGSGYHRGSAGAELPMPARVLAVADVYHAMTERRPHRGPLAPDHAAEELAREASAGRLDADAATAVIEVAGQRPPRLKRPAGLTEREAEVIGLIAHGLQTKEVARSLGISVKTADRHIQNAYGKIGVSSRAAATLFAMEHGLVAWGELPIARPAVHA